MKVGGRYRESEVFERIAAIGAHLAFLPSECPESFMLRSIDRHGGAVVRRLL